MSMTHDTGPDTCPYCLRELGLSTEVGGVGAPAPGDPCICIGCAEIAVFDERMKLRKPTSWQLLALMQGGNWPKIQEARTAVIRAINARRKWGHA